MTSRRVGTALVSTWDVWLALADDTSSINRKEFWEAASTIESLSASLRNLDRCGEFLAREVVLDGTFKVQCTFDPDAVADEASIGAQVTRRTLILPTGRLVVRTAGASANALPMLELAPGRYDVKLEWFLSHESRHYGIESADRYPMADLPDGLVTIRPHRSLAE